MDLTIELLPETSWGKNLRDVITPYKWQKLSQQIQKESDFTCEICHRKKGEVITRLNCHEVWEYTLKGNKQKLIKLQALCFECHCVKHMGYTRSQNWIDEESIIKHFLKINGVSKEMYLKHFLEASELYRERSKIEWVIDFGKWNYLPKEIVTPTKDERYGEILNFLKDNPYATNKQIQEKTGFKTVSRLASLARKEINKQR